MYKIILKKILPNFLINLIRSITNKEKVKLLQKLNFKKKEGIIFLGTKYGGWSFFDNKNLINNYVISAGLGEDASFDIELINKYKCKIIVVDPTPRAIRHYNEIINNAGNSKIKPYNNEGKQNVDNYDLKSINKENFILIDSALYDVSNKEIKFYSPPNKNHVSHSINNFQNNYQKNTDFIIVNTITLKEIIEKFNITNIEMIKLDIEGAEVEVIKNMMDSKIFPNQILVEIDELNKIDKISVERFNKINNLLIENNYELIKTENQFPNFLYLKS